MCCNGYFCDRARPLNRVFGCESRCPLGSQKSLSLSLRLHAVKAQAAAMLCSSCPPSSPTLPRTNASPIAVSPAKPTESGARKYHSVFTSRLGHNDEHSPPRFDKNIYFLSLFAVPNGCRGAAVPPGGATRPFRNRSLLFSKTPAPVFKCEPHEVSESRRWGS